MSAEQDFAFLIQHRPKKTNIYIVDEDGSSRRIPKQSEQYACYTISDGKLTVIHDQYDAIAQPEIYAALMKVVKKSEADNNGKGGGDKLHVNMDGSLSDYLNGQIE